MTFSLPPGNLACLPLGSLDLIAFDTETTGLHLKKARIVEIAAVRVSPGRQEFEDSFSLLVNPDIGIPSAATDIHGIGDEDVTGAPDFADAMAKFAKWTGPSLAVGYSVAFDLAVLEAEHARKRLPWTPPRVLDAQELVQCIGPELPNWSLETVAGWLAIPLEDRHRALPDAVLTAQVFVKLIPKLRNSGIATFAEAERACNSIRSKTGGLGRPDLPKAAEVVNMDSFPFRHRVGAVMASPPIIVGSDLRLDEALGLMATKNLGSLFVALDASGDYGILTERDVLRAIHFDGASALTKQVGDFCSRPLITVARKEFVYRAIIAMSTNGIRHLGVSNDEGELVGAVSARDLFSDHADDAVALGREIEAASSPSDLGRVWSGLTSVVQALANEGVNARDITAIISRELRDLTRRACELAEAELTEASGSAPPTPYAMLVLGSGGRGESLLAMDQDNAIVFREGELGGDADSWFEKLGKRVAETLDESGVRLCSGGVMASNIEWRRDVSGWNSHIAEWLSRTRPEDIMNADIFFDAMPVHGDMNMAETLRGNALRSASEAVPFLRLMATRACEFRSPLGFWGRLRLERGRIDLKKGGIMPIFSAARTVAIEHGILARSTAERLRRFRRLDVVSEAAVDDLISAHGHLLGIILRQQLRDIAAGIPPSNRVAPRELDGAEQNQLKWSLEQIPRVADLLGRPASI